MRNLGVRGARSELAAGLPYYVGVHLLQSGGQVRTYDLLILE